MNPPAACILVTIVFRHFVLLPPVTYVAGASVDERLPVNHPLTLVVFRFPSTPTS